MVDETMQPVIAYERETSTYGKNTDNYLTIYFLHDSDVSSTVVTALNTTNGVKSWYSFRDGCFDCFLVCYTKNVNPEEVDSIIKFDIEEGVKE
jgi:hypothetical protein